MVSEIFEYVKHYLSLRDGSATSHNLRVIYDPYFCTVEIVSTGGKLSIDTSQMDGVIALLHRVKELEKGVINGNEPAQTDAG